MTPSPKEHHTEVTSILANERTYAAWIRTGLASLATGLVATHFLKGYIPDFSVRLMTVILILSSALCFTLAAWRYHHVEKRLTTTNIFGTPVYILIFISSLLVFVSILALLGIWIK